jgi:hypothetical protein
MLDSTACGGSRAIQGDGIIMSGFYSVQRSLVIFRDKVDVSNVSVEETAKMDDALKRALAAAARAFADELERDLPRPPGNVAGSAESMFEVLGSVARINVDHGRGANDDEMRAIAQRAGMDPRGLAGYYSAGLLEKRGEGRWLSAGGRERLDRMSATRGVVILDDGPPHGANLGPVSEDGPRADADDDSPSPAQRQAEDRRRQE